VDEGMIMYWLPVILILPYLILILRNYRSLLKIKTFSISAEPHIFVSVVIACRNEEKNLPSVMNSIGIQDYPENLYEVIIVDDNSTDQTSKIASKFIAPGNVLVLNNRGTGKKQALRTGILAAKADLIITTDADCTMGKSWIRTIAAYYEINGPDMIICPVQIKAVDGLFGYFQELEFLSLQGITAGSACLGDATMCNGANLAFSKGKYLNHSAYLHDEIRSGDDIFLLHSLKKEKNSKIMWLESPDALVTTKGSSSPGSLLKQRSRWISKSIDYTDFFTIFLALTVFVTLLLQIFYFVSMFIFPGFALVFLTVFVLKSLPDILILKNTLKRYNKRSLIRWFLPSQLIYPFYVVGVLFYSLIFRGK
jgi:cellulose synthase/poly-beta-1,6-N-acetylglucosamine synthase-like glycosyltransferase